MGRQKFLFTKSFKFVNCKCRAGIWMLSFPEHVYIWQSKKVLEPTPFLCWMCIITVINSDQWKGDASVSFLTLTWESMQHSAGYYWLELSDYTTEFFWLTLDGSILKLLCYYLHVEVILHQFLRYSGDTNEMWYHLVDFLQSTSEKTYCSSYYYDGVWFLS